MCTTLPQTCTICHRTIKYTPTLCAAAETQEGGFLACKAGSENNREEVVRTTCAGKGGQCLKESVLGAGEGQVRC
ncbi:hypothetical protein PMIN06_005577 [Paraphaeosphaeria minitans]|uniref:Uncharacterized protein n=1 Tax=Paraphaeosphaeria minitans TaxID=565426 RepID=A0A9P6GSM8_9PLEO|nr:hypothetical protein PMIN01_00676 [Paraphaeosphaeria minitans]